MHCILTDFGLMKDVHANNAPLTVAGSFLGTCDYAAPEQLMGERIDARVDVYALGCMLYQAVTGKVPFPRPVSAATMLAHVDEPPPLVTEAAPDAPAALDDVVAHGDGQGPRTSATRRRATSAAPRSEPLGDELRAGVDVDRAQLTAAGVLERVRDARRRDDEVAGARDALLVAERERRLAVEDHEHLLVGVAVQVRARGRAPCRW